MDIYEILKKLNNQYCSISEQKALIHELKKVNMSEVENKIIEEEGSMDDWFHVINFKSEIEKYELSEVKVPRYYCETLIKVLSCYYE